MEQTEGAADREAGLEAGRAWGARHHGLFTLKRLARLLPDPPGGPPSPKLDQGADWAGPWAGPDEGLAGDADADATVRRRLAGDRLAQVLVRKEKVAPAGAPTAAFLAGFVEGARATWDVRFGVPREPYSYW